MLLSTGHSFSTEKYLFFFPQNNVSLEETDLHQRIL